MGSPDIPSPATVRCLISQKCKSDVDVSSSKRTSHDTEWLSRAACEASTIQTVSGIPSSMSTSVQSIGIHLEAIGHVLSDNKLIVPKYQRWYSWEKQHVRDLYSDLWSSFVNKQKEYFLGSIVLARSRGSSLPEVVDGQQRLATVTILIAAIRDYYHKLKDTEGAVEVERTYLLSKDLATRETTPHLALSEYDADFFKKRILSAPGSPDRKVKPLAESHELIAKAAGVAMDWVTKTVTTSNEGIEVLLKWLHILNEQARVIVVQVPDDINAFTIFETLNDRGVDLAISDLLKNFLFRLSGDRLPEVQQRWMSMLGALETIDRDNIVVTYIRHLWSTFHGLTRERELYAAIKTTITSKQSAIDFATALSENAYFYTLLFNPSSQHWKGYAPSVAVDLNTLNLLRMSQMRPLLLAIVAKFNPQQTKEAFRMLVAWSVRFSVTGSLGSGELENSYAEISKQVRDEVVSTPEQLLAAMRPIIPSDPDFVAAFERFKTPKAPVARYLLSELERTATGSPYPEHVPDPNTETVNLEHVLPDSASEHWSSLTPDVALAYHTRLGNMALMNTTANTEVGNEAFTTKQSFYGASNLILTREISVHSSWGPEKIDLRQKRLAELAVQTWPID